METPLIPTSLDHRLREGLARVGAVMRSDDWLRAREAGMNPAQMAILEALEGRENGLSVKEITLILGVSQPSATDSINALERKGYVVKQPVPGDRRAVTVCITDAGRQSRFASDMAVGEADRAIRALSEAEQEDLLISLIKMIRHMQEAGAIPVQRMCASCRYFRPFLHADAARPHHCDFVNASFGQRDLRIECREHETAPPDSRAATWETFQGGLSTLHAT
jgi:DNA-binding MarR family transcriptional regulator